MNALKNRRFSLRGRRGIALAPNREAVGQLDGVPGC